MEGSSSPAPTLARPSLFATLAVVAAGFVVGLGLLYGAERMAQRSGKTVPGLRVLGDDVGGLPIAEAEARIRATADRYLSQPIALSLGTTTVVRTATRRQLGIGLDATALAARAIGFGRGADEEGQPSGVWAPLTDLLRRQRARFGGVDLVPDVLFDGERARDYLVDLKDEVDRAAVDAHLDLDHHTIAPEQPGCLIKVYDGLVAIEYLARAGVNGPRSVSLGTSQVPAKVTAASLAQVDISTVLGTWETHYSSVGVDSDRTYNLKVGADHLNGHILLPGQLFSFNEVVGDRTEKEGYRVAPVISAGELIDGLAGGMCQIASTLHAAAFFGGLEVVSSTPHSRPSAYIPMGLDSTVVYPSTDLKLKNTYDFPIVMHYTVNQGSVKVELLGKARPYRVVFEREIKGETGFGTQVRHDPTAPAGQRFPLQEGYPGYSLIRRRWIFDADNVPRVGPQETIEQALARTHKKAVSKKEWPLHYPSTELILAIGSGPAKMHKKDPPPSHHIPPVRPEDKALFRITR